LIIGILILACLLLPLLVEQPYYLYLINLTGIHAILILGLNLLVGFTGMVSLGHAGFFAIGAYLSTKIVMNLHLPWILGLLGGGTGALVGGLILGIPTNRMKDLTLSLVTLGFGISIYRVLMSWTSFTGGAIGITDVPPASLLGFSFKEAAASFYLIYGILGILLAVAASMAHMRVGRALLAIREDEVAASAMGINSRYYRIMAFAMSAFYCGCAGSLFAHYIGFVSPDSFTFHHSITFVSMVVVGGMGSVAGSFLGAAGLTLILEYFRTFSQYQLVLYGLSVILFVVFLPNGLAGLAEGIERRVSKLFQK
jgi:ABC-type branched-subunit amino acid transport system permease subunit